ncbi:MAG: GDSL-type esterase/lipase family protein [Spirochaetaceae bacterium]
MPLGDSITAGYTDNPDWNYPFEYGYRAALHKKLKTSGLNFEYVGESEEPFNNLYGVPTFNESFQQDNHRGYGGWDIRKIEKNIQKWIKEDQPDIILLMIGINGISIKSPEQLDSLVRTIFDTSPNIKLLVAQITPLQKFNKDIVNYNLYIRKTLVPVFDKMGFSIGTVDQYVNFLTDPKDLESIDADCFSNSINHPTNSCYQKIATSWFQGITKNRLNGTF